MSGLYEPLAVIVILRDIKELMSTRGSIHFPGRRGGQQLALNVIYKQLLI